MKFTNSKIGTAKDNAKSSIHNWYRFTAGFSYKLVNKIITDLDLNAQNMIFEPFAGCGTTLVEAQKHQIPAIGNEGQIFMMDVIKAKLAWNVDKDKIKEFLNEIETITFDNTLNINTHKLLISLYEPQNLSVLYAIKDKIVSSNLSEEYALFLKLALSQTLHKSSIYPISVPYISRNKKLHNSNNAFEIFKEIVLKMLYDLNSVQDLETTSKIFLYDSRKENKDILEYSCDVCITSPPYLNNLDYGEVSKVHTHFFGITSNWNDITKKVRKNLVTASTTHYTNSQFDLDQWKTQEFYTINTKVCHELLQNSEKIKEVRKLKNGNKSFDIMLLYYFEDMYFVLKEIRRVLKNNSKAYLILGDSAPYGVFIPTTDILGEIALNVGFKQYEKFKIRERGAKWKSLRYRHSLKLDENILVLQ